MHHILWRIFLRNLALSRRDEDKELQGIARPFWPDIAEFDEEVKKDLVLAQSLEDLKVDPNSHPQYTLEQDRLYYKGRLVLLTDSTWIPKLLQKFHTSPIGGHSGIYRTYRMMAQCLF